MTPYGILYKENILSFEESIRIWQQKCGILKKSSLIKLFLLLFVEIAAAASVLVLMKADLFFVTLILVTGIAVSVMNYFMVIKRVTKNTALMNFRPADSLKQIVLFEERLEYTSSYGKARYFYDEIKCVHEKNGIITIILEKEVIPCSVPFMGIKKGDYRRFTEILKQKTASVYQFEGGNI